MKKLDTSTFDYRQRRVLFHIANEVGSIIPIAAVGIHHVGELYEAMIFLAYFPRGSDEHKQLSARLCETAPTEAITHCIKRIAPEFHKQSMESMAAFLGEPFARSKYDEVFYQVFDMLDEWCGHSVMLQ
jgi:hypothetical protein